MKINIVAVPIKHHNPLIDYFDFHHGHEANRYSLWENYPHFHSGYLDDTIQKIYASISERYDKRVEITSYELVFPEPNRQDYHFTQSELNTLAEQLKHIKSDSDLLILLGGDHTGGYILYHLPGVVVRFDNHTDRVEWYDKSVPIVSCATYVSAALDSGIKKENEIIEYKPDELVKRLSTKADSIFDVDFDAFPEDLHIISQQRGYEHGQASPTNLYQTLQTFNPSSLGFFEYYPEDDIEGNGFRIIVNSIITVLEHRLKE